MPGRSGHFNFTDMKTFRNIVTVLALLLLLGSAFLVVGISSPCGSSICLRIRCFMWTRSASRPPPEKIYVDRIVIDTLPMPGDTVKIPVEIPIERKTYNSRIRRNRGIQGIAPLDGGLSPDDYDHETGGAL